MRNSYAFCLFVKSPIFLRQKRSCDAGNNKGTLHASMQLHFSAPGEVFRKPGARPRFGYTVLQTVHILKL